MKHLILDTSIFIRFLTHDIEDQYQDARQIFVDIEEGLVVGYVSILTIQELVWILEYTYLIPREEFIPLLLTLFSLKNLKIVEYKKALLRPSSNIHHQASAHNRQEVKSK